MDDVRPLRRSLQRASATLSRPLPWIGHPDPWAVFVAEIMLQQTQTSRVLEPWSRFLHRFPSPAAMAEAPLGDVLEAWAGLGYHRRARNLHAAAKVMVDEHGGRVPSDLEELRRLPGVGEYTSRAVATFAFDTHVGVLDTNVGRVVSRALVNRQLRPREAQSLVDELVPSSNPRAFNQALLDLGAQFCLARPKCADCPVRRVCRYHLEGGADPAPNSAGVSRPQSPFKGSDREVRGRVLARLREGVATWSALRGASGVTEERLNNVVAALEREGLLEIDGALVALPGRLR